MKKEQITEEKDVFLDSLNELSTSSIAPKLPRKYPPISSYMIKGAIILLLACLLIYCLSQVFASIKGYRETDDLYGSIAEQWGSLNILTENSFAVSKSAKNSRGNETQNYGTPTEPEAPNVGTDDSDMSATLILLQAKFASLKELNSDVVGWITVPDTNIDYPIVHTDDNDYYLRRSITGSYLTAGTIFADYRNIGDWSDQNTVLYGHNMASGAMFANLAKFKSYSFYKKNPYVYIQTESAIYVYKVFSIYETNKYDPYIRVSFNNAKDFKEWANSRKSLSYFSSSYKFQGEEQVLTLSTCTNGFGKDGRLAVHAVLVEVQQ